MYNEAIEKFENYLKNERGHSKNTIKTYKFNLEKLIEYVEKEIKEIDKKDIREYLSKLISEEGLSENTRNNRLFTYKSFFSFLVKDEVLEKNPAKNIDVMSKKEKAEPVYLKPDEVENYIEAIKLTGKGFSLRDTAIVKMFLYTGMRLNELIALNIGDIKFGEKYVKILGKGNKERVLPLRDEVVFALKEYLNDREIRLENDAPLFISSRGNRIGERTVQKMVKKYAKRADIENADKITPHKLRHTFASLLYRKTKDLKILQDLLGHESINTTQIYTHIDTEQKKKALSEIDSY